MTWKYAVPLAASLCGLTAPSVTAQSPAPFPPAGVMTAGAEQVQSGVIGLDPVNVGRPVANAPYSAESITEMTQTLADGNRIERRTTALVARDSQGRTRREQQGIALGPYVAQNDQPIVTITDPTTGTHVTLNYAQKVAFRLKSVRMALGDAELALRNDLRARRRTAMSANGATPPSAGTAAVPPALGMPPVDVAIVGPSVAAAPGDVFAGGIAAVRFEGDVRTDKLPPQIIEGIPAEGTRTTMTIPAGAMGNALPIEVVSERWYSPELDVVLMTRRSDPRFGDTVYRLTNITRGEPSADLFNVPSDFKIEDVRPGKMLPLREQEQQEQ